MHVLEALRCLANTWNIIRVVFFVERPFASGRAYRSKSSDSSDSSESSESNESNERNESNESNESTKVIGNVPLLSYAYASM